MELPMQSSNITTRVYLKLLQLFIVIITILRVVQVLYTLLIHHPL